MQLQRLSVDDGPGVRTIIFLPGCPLRCLWCANPEGWVSTDLSETITADEIVRRVERDAVFFRYSGGGVTFSGGEPTVQKDFLRALVAAFDSRSISMWIETCGYFNFAEVGDIFNKMEHVFYDIKCIDPARHKELTGRDNALILENAVHLRDAGVPLTIRFPAVKGANFTNENLTATALFMKENLPGVSIELLPYHSLGQDKYKALGLADRFHAFDTPTETEMAEAKTLFRKHGVEATSLQSVTAAR